MRSLDRFMPPLLQLDGNINEILLHIMDEVFKPKHFWVLHTDHQLEPLGPEITPRRL